MSTPEKVSILNDIFIAAPCHAKWSEMAGDERARFCQLCSKHVYNLSAMSRAEAEALVKEKEGKLCVRFYRRADGTMITDNCPVGLRRVRERLRWIGAGFAAVVAFVASRMPQAGRSGTNGSVKSWFVEQPAAVPVPVPVPMPMMGGCGLGPTPPESSDTAETDS